MGSFESFDVADLKLIYRTLHAHLLDHLELMDSAFFSGLQAHLQGCARADGVDLADHGQWDTWLGNTVVSCDERMKARKTL